MIAHGRKPRNSAQNLAIHALGNVPNEIANNATGNNDTDARDGGLNCFNVRVLQTVLEHVTLPAVGNFLFFRRFDAAQDDILAAQILDLLLGLVAGALANSQHCDHGTNAKDYAKRRQ